MIEINNLTNNPVDEKFLKKVAEIVLKNERKKKNLSIALVYAARIKRLNQKYRKKNRATDILSFTYDDLGEIVICPSEVKQNAKKFTPLEIIGAKNKKSKSLTEFKSDFRTELFRVLIHGILHILGYDHEKSGKDAKIMEEKQEYYLSLIKNQS